MYEVKRKTNKFTFKHDGTSYSLPAIESLPVHDVEGVLAADGESSQVMALLGIIEREAPGFYEAATFGEINDLTSAWMAASDIGLGE